MTESDWWQAQLSEASLLATPELERHALVSTRNRHRCRQCFCCAALTILERRKAALQATKPKETN